MVTHTGQNNAEATTQMQKLQHKRKSHNTRQKQQHKYKSNNVNTKVTTQIQMLQHR